jgi:hypothetical protein
LWPLPGSAIVTATSSEVKITVEPESGDVSVPGRDVTDNSDVIYSFPKREVLLLAPPHGYVVRP